MKINKLIDHTLLKAFATSEDITKLCKEALEYDFASVCVNPANVSLASLLLANQLANECIFKDDYILSGEIVSVYKMYKLTNKAIAINRKVPRLPMFLVWLGIPFVPYLSPIVFELLKTNPEYDCSKAIRDLNYQHTSFEETINKTVNWFKNKK